MSENIKRATDDMIVSSEKLAVEAEKSTSKMTALFSKAGELISSSASVALNGITMFSAAAGSALLEISNQSAALGTDGGFATTMTSIGESAQGLMASLGGFVLPDLASAFQPLKDSFTSVIGEMEVMKQQGASAFDIGAMVATNLIASIPNILTSFASLAVSLGEGLMGAIAGLQAAAPAIGESIGLLINSVVTLLFNTLPDLIDTLATVLITAVETIDFNQVGQMAVVLVTTLIGAIIRMIPALIGVAGELIAGFVTGLAEGLPNIIASLVEGLTQVIPAILEVLPEIINAFLTFFPVLITSLIEEAPRIILALIDGVVQTISQLVNILPALITGFIDIIMKLVPSIIENAPQILQALATGIMQAIPQLLEAVTRIPIMIIEAITGGDFGIFIQNGWKTIQEFAAGVWNGITGFFSSIGSWFGQIPGKIWDAIKGVAKLGGDMITGLWEGISNVGKWLWDKISGFFGGIVDGIKGFFGIKSPSRLFASIGRDLDRGLAKGIIDNSGLVDNAMGSIEKLIAVPDYSNSFNNTLSHTIDGNIARSLEMAPTRSNGQALIENNVEVYVEQDNFGRFTKQIKTRSQGRGYSSPVIGGAFNG